MHDLQLAAGAFLTALAGQPLVQALMGGGHVNVTRDAVTSTVLAAAVAALHKLLPEGK